MLVESSHQAKSRKATTVGAHWSRYNASGLSTGLMDHMTNLLQDEARYISALAHVRVLGPGSTAQPPVVVPGTLMLRKNKQFHRILSVSVKYIPRTLALSDGRPKHLRGSRSRVSGSIGNRSAVALQ